MLLFLLSFGVLLCCSIVLFLYVDEIQQDAYMDEKFHIPQAQQYCNGNFTSWDPMITTLPALYLMSVGLLKPVSAVMSVPLANICTPTALRSINILFAMGNFYLVYAIMKKIHNPLTDTDWGLKVTMTSVALATFPVQYFFTFLYYTDAGSTFCVLLMYALCVHDRHHTAAAIGGLAIMFRQTNIIWVVFCAGLVVRKEVILWMMDACKKKDINVENLGDFDLLKTAVTNLYETAFKQRRVFKRLVIKIITNTIGYILVGFGFALFVFVNKGIVVGDRSQHVPGLNFPQIFYFLSVANFFAVFQLTSPSKVMEFLKFCWKRPVLAVSFLLAAIIVVHFFTYEHKYLLSDNRHYTFYVWHKLYRRHVSVKYILTPVYLYCTWTFLTALTHRDVFWKIVYFVCLFACIVPQQLLEYRYFILPYCIYRINMRYSTLVGLLHEILLYFAVNAITLYLFTQKPFHWPHEAGTQRFMW